MTSPEPLTVGGSSEATTTRVNIMPHSNGDPTLLEQLDEDACMRFYAANILKEAQSLVYENKKLLEALKTAHSEINGPDYPQTKRGHARRLISASIIIGAAIAKATED